MITNKELKCTAYQGCRCRYCFNKKVLKQELDTRRSILKRDTLKEIKSHNLNCGFYL